MTLSEITELDVYKISNSGHDWTYLPMRELLGWLVAFSFIVVAWIVLYGMANFATHIPADEPPGAFGVGPMYLLPFAFLLLMMSGTWVSAALIRAFVLIFRFIAHS